MKKTALLLLGLALTLQGVRAQSDFRAAYFMAGYIYGHTMNPALYANRNYIGIGVGNATVRNQSNLGFKTFFYPSGSQTVSFLDESVASSEFLGKLRPHNLENIDLRETVLSFGFWTPRNHYHTFDLSVRAVGGLSVPYDIFRFMKEGSTDGTGYDLSGLSARARAFAEASYGVSRPVTDRLRIGAKAKLLVGLVYADARFNRFDVNLSGERWSVASEGELQASNLPITDASQAVQFSDLLDVDSFEWEEVRPSGYGAAVDLGATWQATPWLEVSGSLLDLGFIHWRMDRMTADGNWEYTGFDNIDPSVENGLQEQLDRKLDELDALTRFRRSDKGKPMDFLPLTLHAGAKAKPSDWFSAGILATGHVEGKYSWAELRGSLNLEPANWLGLTAGGAYGTFGPKVSSALNFRLPLIALFVGAELSSPYFVSERAGDSRGLVKIFKDGDAAFPRDNLNLQIAVGLNFVFGKTADKRLNPGRYTETDN